MPSRRTPRATSQHQESIKKASRKNEKPTAQALGGDQGDIYRIRATRMRK
jgi:hypothetical protein